MNKYETSNLNVKYMQRQELESLKKKLLLKVLRDFNNKYSNLLNNKEVRAEVYNKELEKEIEKNFDFNNPDYAPFFQKVEKILLGKLNKIQDKKRNSMMNRQEAEEIAEGKLKNQENVGNFNYENGRDKNSTIQKQKTLPDSTNSFNNKNALPNRKNYTLRDKLKKKEGDEWAQIIKSDYEEYVKSNEARTLESIKLKQAYLHKLQDQSEEKKRIDEKRRREEEESLDKLQKLTLDQAKHEEELKQQNFIKKREMHLKLLHENERNREISKLNINNLLEEERKIDEELRIYLQKEEMKREEQQKAKNLAEKELKDFIKKQIEEKQIEKTTAKKLKDEEQKNIIKYNEEIEKEKLRKHNEEKERKFKYKQLLDDQLEMKQDLPSMNETEKKINKKLLERSKVKI